MRNAIIPGPPGLLRPTRTPLDANHVICWSMEGTTGNVLNTGTGGVADLIPRGSPGPVRNLPGLFGGCVAIAPDRGFFSTARAPTPANIFPTTFTVDLWISGFFDYLSTTVNMILVKKYAAADTWNSPYMSTGLWNLGGLTGQVAVAGSRFMLGYDNGGATGARVAIPGGWTHLAFTWDNSAKRARLWMNAKMIVERISASSLDKGGNAEWCIGCRHTNSTLEPSYMLVEDVRISDVERDASYFENIVRSALPGEYQP